MPSAVAVTMMVAALVMKIRLMDRCVKLQQISQVQWVCRYASKDIRFGVEACALMLQAVEQLADAVQVTMGPKQSYGSPNVTKDGVTVGKSIEFKDKLKNLGAILVKQVVNATNDVAGDAIFSEGCKSVAAGMNAMDLQRGINLAVDSVVNHLKGRPRMISSSKEIAQVVTISANGDHEIGDLIAQGMESGQGWYGFFLHAGGKTLFNELEVVEGLKLDRGYISPYFVTNAKTQKVELENAVILVHEKKILSITSILPVLELVVWSEALAKLIVNKLCGGVKVCAIKAPSFVENRKANLQDLAVVTGVQLISGDLGLKLENVQADMLGSAKRVTVSKDDTIILDGGGDKKGIEERCEQIREAISTATSDYDKEKLQECLAKLSGGVAVLKIGGASEVEVNEKKDRVTPRQQCGGVALLYASRDLDKLPTANFDQKVGVQLIQNTLKVPLFLLLEQSEYVDMVKAGIRDPVKVIRTALTDAATFGCNVSSLMTTTEAVVVDFPKEEKQMVGMGGMGGGGMGGMDY
ncbi:hypothetical protein CY35_01G167900 [Sphagnum magellanicum]|nr:hypothetical protein CY35_01G167900 [Sphagnum magellanicum]